jgi:hypothetical protein
MTSGGRGRRPLPFLPPTCWRWPTPIPLRQSGQCAAVTLAELLEDGGQGLRRDPNAAQLPGLTLIFDRFEFR